MEPQAGKRKHNPHRPSDKSKGIGTSETEVHFKEETLKDVNNLLWKITWQYHARYGQNIGTPDELFSEACFAFVEAYNSYNPSKGAFTTHLYWKVNGRLQTMRRTKMRQRKVEPLQDDTPYTQRTWRSLLNDLSDDALSIIQLVVDTPAGLKAILSKEQQTLTRKGKRTHTRITLRQYLDGAGWTDRRINEAFRELQDALI